MSDVRDRMLMASLFLSLWYLCVPSAAQENPATNAGQGSEDKPKTEPQPASADPNQENSTGTETNEIPPSAVFSRGIILPEGWDPSKDAAPPAAAIAPAEEAAPAASSEVLPPANPIIQPAYGAREEEMAHHAWRYMTASREASTGLYDSVIHYPATTIWDVGSSLAALVSAERLELMSPSSFRLQMRQLLTTLGKMPLYHDELPNREYNVRNLEMLDHRSLPSDIGTGWSALDIGRILIWLKIVSLWYPEMKPLCEQIVARWDFRRLRLHGEANGVSVENGKEYLRQEGRLGYEQYAAKGFSLWGIELPVASGYTHVSTENVLDIELRRDSRSHSFLTGEPFFLAQMELGTIDPIFDELGGAVFAVEKRRWEETGVLTAVSEDSVSLQPWFVYNTILYNDNAWECVTPGGTSLPGLKSMSTKAAISYAALSDDPYALELERAAESLVHPLYGYYAGKYEKGGINVSLNLNTNAIVLEAMLYRKLGRRAFLPAATHKAESAPAGPNAAH